MIERSSSSNENPEDSAVPLGLKAFKIFMYAWPKELREELGEDCLETDRLILAKKQGLDKILYITGNCWGFIATGIELRVDKFRSKQNKELDETGKNR